MANIQSNINQLLAMASRLSIGGGVILGQKNIAKGQKQSAEAVNESIKKFGERQAEDEAAISELTKKIKELSSEDKQIAYTADQSEAMYKELEAEALERGYSSVEEYRTDISIGQKKAIEEAKKAAALKEKQEEFKKLVFQGTPYENIANPEILKRGNK